MIGYKYIVRNSYREKNGELIREVRQYRTFIASWIRWIEVNWEEPISCEWYRIEPFEVIRSTTKGKKVSNF